MKSLKERGDFLGFYKNLPKENPNMRMHVGNVGNRVVIQLLDPKLIKEFFASQHHYQKIPFSDAFQSLVGTGILRAEGNVWKQHRKILSNMFHFEFIKQNIPLMVNTTREFLSELEQGSLENVMIMDEIQKITGEIVGRIFFGENLNKYKLNGQLLTLYLADLLVDIFRLQRTPLLIFLRFSGLPNSLSPKLRSLLRRVDEFREICVKIVKDRKAANIKANDMLDLLLKTQSNPNKEESFSDEDIVNEFITFFAAGMDTTGHIITMMLYLLDRNPQYKTNFENEIQSIYNRNEPVDQDSVSQMEFTHAFLKEALRFYSPAPGTFPRVANVDHNLLDVKIKKGMSVRPNPMFNCFNPKYFESPEEFKPNRWLNKSALVDSFAYIPFSAGARNCIGQHLSVMETKIIMSEFLKKFDFEVTPGYKLKMTVGFLYEPADKLTLNLKPRINH